MCRPAIPPLLLFLCSLLICVTFTLSSDPLPLQDDAAQYFRLAENVADGKGFTLDGTDPYAYRAPLFSALLGVWFVATGHATVLSARLYQCTCIALSVVFAYYLAMEIFGRRRTATVVASLLAIHPSVVTSTAFILQEPTLLLVTTLTVWGTLRWFRLGGRGAAAAAGASWGVATLGKVVTAFLPMMPFIFLLLRGKRGARVSVLQTLWACAAFAMVLLPWTARNYYHFHRLIPVNDQGMGMLEWNVRHANPQGGETLGFVSNLARSFHDRRADPAKANGEAFVEALDDQGVRGDARRDRLVEYVSKHWRYFLAQRVWNAVYFALPSIDWWIYSGKVRNAAENFAVLAFALVILPFYVFLAVRVWGLVGGAYPGYAILYVVLFFLCYWGTYAMLVGEPRFSLPVYPCLISLAPWEKWA
jgi:4-amino-4-deoxy-L-arabinose transferase-like glycosyltransferase